MIDLLFQENIVKLMGFDSIEKLLKYKKNRVKVKTHFGANVNFSFDQKKANQDLNQFELNTDPLNEPIVENLDSPKFKEENQGASPDDFKSKSKL